MNIKDTKQDILERIADDGADLRGIHSVILTDNVKGNARGEVTASGEGQHGEEPLQATQKSSRLLEHLHV